MELYGYIVIEGEHGWRAVVFKAFISSTSLNYQMELYRATLFLSFNFLGMKIELWWSF